jgi:hypothetical protein
MTLPGTDSARNVHRAGFRLAYNKVILRREYDADGQPSPRA